MVCARYNYYTHAPTTCFFTQKISVKQTTPRMKKRSNGQNVPALKHPMYPSKSKPVENQ